MAVKPLQKIKKVIKRSKRFTRFQCDKFPHKMKEDESSPPNDQDTEEKGTQNDREQNEVSKFGNFSKLEKFPELLLNHLQNIST